MSGIELPQQIQDAMYRSLTAQGFDPGETAGVFCIDCHMLFWVEADIDGVPHVPSHVCAGVISGDPQP